MEVHRPTFDAWPAALQDQMRAAAREAIVEQRAMHDQAEIHSQAIFRAAGGDMIELTVEQRGEFVEAVQPIYADARTRYYPELVARVGIKVAASRPSSCPVGRVTSSRNL